MIREEWIRESTAASVAEKAAHRVFLEIDRQSMPTDRGSGLENPLVTAQNEAIHGLGTALTLRYVHGARAWAAGQSPVGNSAAPTVALEYDPLTDIPLQKQVAKIFMSSLAAANDGGLDGDFAREAFFRFGCGECIAFDAAGAPNGINMFSFAEMALLIFDNRKSLDLESLAGELGVQLGSGTFESFWRDLAVAVAASSEIFVRCFRDGGGRTACAYRAQNNAVPVPGDPLGISEVRPARTFDEDAKQAIFNRWQDCAQSKPCGTELGALRVELGRLVCSAIFESLQDADGRVEGRLASELDLLDLANPAPRAYPITPTT